MMAYAVSLSFPTTGDDTVHMSVSRALWQLIGVEFYGIIGAQQERTWAAPRIPQQGAVLRASLGFLPTVCNALCVWLCGSSIDVSVSRHQPPCALSQLWQCNAGDVPK
jgi:hypothetical protein